MSCYGWCPLRIDRTESFVWVGLHVEVTEVHNIESPQQINHLNIQMEVKTIKAIASGGGKDYMNATRVTIQQDFVIKQY